MIFFHGRIDVGRQRRLNEDAIFAYDGLSVISEDMGGHQPGGAASQAALHAIAALAKRSAANAEITSPYGFRPSVSAEMLNT